MTELHLNTKLIHTGEHDRADGRVVPTSTPIHSSTTYVYSSAAALDDAFAAGDTNVYYIRHGGPTTNQLEQVMTVAEGGRGAVACSSGMAAIYLAILAAGTPRGSMAPQPRHVLASHDLYGADHVLLRDFIATHGAQITYCDMCDMGQVAAQIEECEPDVVLVESISNPLLKIADIATIAKLARAADARLIVDATLTTPILQQPLQLGADIVVHSATKYLSGHGDALGGVAVARTSLVLDTLRNYAHTLGMNLGAFEARMISRGIKTLELRLHRQCASALYIATALEQHPAVKRVIYPGLTSHPQHAFAAAQFGGKFGGMIAFELAQDSREAAFKFMDALSLVLPATSLGDIYSMVTYPPLSSHRELSVDQRRAQGIGDGLIRLSVGIEDVDDILQDLTRALALL